VAKMTNWQLAMATVRGLVIVFVAGLGTKFVLDLVGERRFAIPAVARDFVLMIVMLIAIAVAASPIARYLKERQ